MSLDRYGLVAHYGHHLTDGKLLDMSGKGNHGTINGATPTTDHNGRANRAWSSDGINDVVTIPNTIVRNKSKLTIVAGIYNQGGHNNILWKRTGTDNNTIFAFRVASPGGTLSVFFGTGTALNRADSYSTDFANKWSLVAMVFDGSGSTNSDRLKMYVNGVAVSISLTGTIPAVTNDFNDTTNILGNDFTSNWIAEKRDFLAIYDVAKSASEIQKLYNYWRTH